MDWNLLLNIGSLRFESYLGFGVGAEEPSNHTSIDKQELLSPISVSDLLFILIAPNIH